MGLSLRLNSHRGAISSRRQALQHRFGSHFPQLFAYVRTRVGEASAADGVVARAFARAFTTHAQAPDEEFRLALFETARRLCRPSPQRPRSERALSTRQREVISLLFDARLNRGEIGAILKVNQEAVNAALIAGLEKLRANAVPVAAVEFASH